MVTIWRQVVCEECGARYRDFRAPGQPTFKDAREDEWRDHRKRVEERSDYSQPPCRSRILWRMHSYKRGFWEEHVYHCERRAHG